MGFTDVVVPRNNEGEFIRVAERLGFSGLLFLYPEKGEPPRDLDLLRKGTALKLFTGVIISDVNRAKSLKKKYDLIFSFAERQFFESKSVDVIFSQENSARRDFMHSRNSGLNQVLAKECKAKDKILALNFSLLLNQKNRAVVMGRMMQNIIIQRKYRFSMMIASFATTPWQMRGARELKSLLIALGMQQGDAKAAVNILGQRLSV